MPNGSPSNLPNPYDSPLAYARISLELDSFLPPEDDPTPEAGPLAEDEAEPAPLPEAAIQEEEFENVGSVEDFEPFPLPSAQQFSSTEPLPIDLYEGEPSEELLTEMPGLDEETFQEMALPERPSAREPYEEVWSVNPPESFQDPALPIPLPIPLPERDSEESFNDISLRDYEAERLAEPDPAFAQEAPSDGDDALGEVEFTEISGADSRMEPLGDLLPPEATPDEDLTPREIELEQDEMLETGTPPVQVGPASWDDAFPDAPGLGEDIASSGVSSQGQVGFPDMGAPSDQEQILRDMAIKEMIERETMYQNMGGF